MFDAEHSSDIASISTGFSNTVTEPDKTDDDTLFIPDDGSYGPDRAPATNTSTFFRTVENTADAFDDDNTEEFNGSAESGIWVSFDQLSDHAKSITPVPANELGNGSAHNDVSQMSSEDFDEQSFNNEATKGEPTSEAISDKQPAQDKLTPQVDPLRAPHTYAYLAAAVDNPYASAALRPSIAHPSAPTPKSAYEARALLAKDAYNKPPPPLPSISTLEALLIRLRRNLAKSKLMLQTAGLTSPGSGDTDLWKSINTTVDSARPDIKRALRNDPENGLETYASQIDKWDKAVGQRAILMKAMLWADQVKAVERKIFDVKLLERHEREKKEREEKEKREKQEKRDSEWKATKTGKGRRFAGLIEKD
jgi:hypothetical protein